MANSYRRRRPKTGSTAIPFLITILISMIVLGSIAYYFYGKIKHKNVNLQPMKSAVTSISENDINEKPQSCCCASIPSGSRNTVSAFR